jgi:hypothetical protein
MNKIVHDLGLDVHKETIVDRTRLTAHARRAQGFALRTSALAPPKPLG